MMEKRSLHRTPVQVSGTCLFTGDGGEISRQCILMDVSLDGVGMLVSSPFPVSRNMKIIIEFPVHSRTAQACIDVKWARALHEISHYNWATGGVWIEIGKVDRQMLMEFAAENYSAINTRAEK